MKTTTPKTSVTIATLAMYLLSMNAGLAQGLSRRSPDKPLKIESVTEETKQPAIKNEADIYCSVPLKNLSKSKADGGKGPCLLNGINLANSVKNYAGASVFHQPGRINGLFKRKYSPSFK
jgi:hypothetical protein